MIQPLVIYPDERVNIACTDVRSFNDTLANVIEDMKDTMQEHNLEALSAIQIAYPYNIILVKNADNYDEYINPRILSNSEPFESTESTLYYPEVTVKVQRYQKMKLIYENRKGEAQHLDVDDKEFAALMQRKLDYLYGGTFLDKVSKEKREKIVEALAGQGLIPQVDDVCPTFSKKDYFVSFTDKILFFMGLSLLTPLFSFEKGTIESIYTFDKFAFPIVIVLMISYFLYAQYEAKKYSQCSSCQVGNNIGVVVKRFVVAMGLAVGAYFLVNPY